MKKLFYSLIGAALLSLSAHATTTNITISSGGYSNVFVGGARVTQVVIAPATAGTAGSIRVFDASQNTSQTYTNPAYITRGFYVTNYITNWVNFFGNTDSWTNKSLVNYTSTVPAVTNTWPVRLAATTVTNGTTVLDGVTYQFNLGFNVTNLGPASVTVSVTYQQ